MEKKENDFVVNIVILRVSVQIFTTYPQSISIFSREGIFQFLGLLTDLF